MPLLSVTYSFFAICGASGQPLQSLMSIILHLLSFLHRTSWRCSPNMDYFLCEEYTLSHVNTPKNQEEKGHIA